MISIECHRSGERCPGKREFDNRIEINRVRSGEIDVAIPFSTVQSSCVEWGLTPQQQPGSYQQGRVQDLWKGGGAAATASAVGAKVFGGSRLKALFGISKGGGGVARPLRPPPESASDQGMK